MIILIRRLTYKLNAERFHRLQIFSNHTPFKLLIKSMAVIKSVTYFLPDSSIKKSLKRLILFKTYGYALL